MFGERARVRGACVSTCGRLGISAGVFSFQTGFCWFLFLSIGRDPPLRDLRSWLVREENGVDSGRARCTVHTRRRREGGDDVEPDELEEAVCHLPAMRGGRVLRYDTPDFTEWVANSSA